MGCYYTLVPFMCPQYNNLSNNLHFYIVIFTNIMIPRKRHKSATNLHKAPNGARCHFGAGDSLKTGLEPVKGTKPCILLKLI